MSFGEAVRAERMKAGLTQVQLAENTGMSKQLLCEIETGKIMPSINTFILLDNTFPKAGLLKELKKSFKERKEAKKEGGEN